MQLDEFGYIMILFDTFWTKYFEIYEVKKRDIPLLLLLFFHFFGNNVINNTLPL